MNGQARHRVVIVGGGFAGLFAVRAMRRGRFAVTLIGAVLTWWVAFTRDVRRERAFTAREVGQLPTVYDPTGAGQRSGGH